MDCILCVYILCIKECIDLGLVTSWLHIFPFSINQTTEFHKLHSNTLIVIQQTQFHWCMCVYVHAVTELASSKLQFLHKH